METKQKPFFAKLLEAQATQQPDPIHRIANTGEQLWETWITKPTLDIEHTQKYPSDGDEI